MAHAETAHTVTGMDTICKIILMDFILFVVCNLV